MIHCLSNKIILLVTLFNIVGENVPGKCERYWPEGSKRVETFGSYEVSLERSFSQIAVNGIAVSKLKVESNLSLFSLFNNKIKPSALNLQVGYSLMASPDGEHYSSLSIIK